MGIEVHQPIKVKTGNLDEWIRNRDADVVVVMAYGRILPPAVLGAPRLGCVNLHASLLPRYRGAAPIQWAIIRGEAETGVSLMQMDEGLDTGPVYAMRRLPIGEKEDAGSLADRIADLSADVVREDLPRVLSGELAASSQDDAQATFAPPITAEATVIDFTSLPRDIVNLVRGLSPRPGAQTRLRGRRFKVLAATVASGSSDAPAGTVVFADRRGAAVSAGGSLVRIVRGQLEGRKVLDAVELLNGRVLRVGDRLGEAAGEA